MGIIRPGTVDDDALGVAQLLTAAIWRELATCYSICKCSVSVHVHADIWVSLFCGREQWRELLTLVPALL